MRKEGRRATIGRDRRSDLEERMEQEENNGTHVEDGDDAGNGMDWRRGQRRMEEEEMVTGTEGKLHRV
jgi:hypothetical protein